jgi:ComF family protein
MYRRNLAALVDAVYPRRCAECKTVFSGAGAGGDHPLAPFFCRDCRRPPNITESPLCVRCGRMFAAREGDDRICGFCLTVAPPYQAARAYGPYEDNLRAVIRRYKYAAAAGLAGPLAALLNEAYGRFFEASAHDVAVPVPLHPRRLRKRGFNQTALLLRRWIRSTGGASPPPPQPAPETIRRIRDTISQAGLNRRERMQNLKGAFTVPDDTPIRKKRVLLVDDVLTTGTTVEKCARLLMKHGAASVDVLTLARVYPEGTL